jgi:hypothetical protein
VLQSVLQHPAAHDAQPNDGHFVCHVSLLWVASLARLPHSPVAFAMPLPYRLLSLEVSRMLLTALIQRR